jgi:guanylate kinase
MDLKPCVFLFSAPSGTGKTTIIYHILNKSSQHHLCVSHTTRFARSNEKDGKDYFFIKKEEFKQLIEKNFFLEWASVFDHYYGTSYEQIDFALNQKKNLILDLDVSKDQFNQLKKNTPSLISIFILPPSVETLRRRLINRSTESLEMIEKRMKKATQHLELAPLYDYQIMNDVLENCIEEIESIINKHSSPLT